MPTVLVTGASRGIGRATVERLVAEGWEVVAGVRVADDAAALERDTGARAVLLDVANADHIAALPEALDRLDAVVNNAGIVVSGPVEGLPLAVFRRQMEVNLIGQIGVTQAVLPLIRSTQGRIVFVSSVSGRVATPMTGAYNASKFALEGMADALRMELRPWGVRVVLVEPAQTATDMWSNAHEQLDTDLSVLSDAHRALYAGHIEGAHQMIGVSQRMASPVEGVAAAIEKALTARWPRARYVVGAGPKAQTALTKVTPTPVLDAARRKLNGVPTTPLAGPESGPSSERPGT